MGIPRARLWRAFCVAILLYTGGAETRTALAQRDVVVLGYDQQSPPLRYAASEIRRELAAKGVSLVEQRLDALLQSPQPLRMALLTAADPAKLAADLRLAPVAATAPQSYAIRKHSTAARTTFIVIGADAAGAMYGGLDLAEAIRLGTLAEISDADHQPYIEKRGIKFNIPLDARTPSYSDNSDAAQANIPEMWSADFWREFLDEMARQRFNVLTLWNLHPFPSLVKVPEYPEVALHDVARTTLKMDATYRHDGHDMYRPAMADRLEIVKRLTIDEKVQFWREVMQYAHDRGIEVYLFTWNIFTWGAEGKYGITPAQDNPITIDYFRASVRETVLTYPLLAGIGITAGERMQQRTDEFAKEQWLWKTYGAGIRDALQRQPQRHFRVIHRYHQTAHADILAAWEAYPSTLDLSFKYAIAHMYSVPNPPFIKAVLPHLSPARRTWLTLRNDDIYSFRWGDPAFARAFLRNLPGPDKVAGFYMGPDGYNWGREFLSTEPETPRQLVLKKQWYSFMLWGRLSYEPALPDTLFERTLAQRFPEVPAAPLFHAWSAASHIIPQITRFFWGDIDLYWYPEACLSHPHHQGWYTVRHFIEGETMPESGILNIRTWRARRIDNQSMHGSTPLQVADALQGYATTTLQLVAALRPQQGHNKELRLTLGDLEAMAHLGNYYAAKIRGAAELALFDALAQEAHQAAAVRALAEALTHWQLYATVYSRQYTPQLLNRVGFVDIPGLIAQVAQDVVIAQDWQPGTITESAATEHSADTPFTP